MRLWKPTLAWLTWLAATSGASGQPLESLGPAPPPVSAYSSAAQPYVWPGGAPPALGAEAAPPQAPAYGIDPSCLAANGPRFIVTVDAIALFLPQLHTTPLALDNVTSAALLTNKDAESGLQFGPRVTSTYLTDEGPGCQLDYYGVYDWSGDAEAANPGRLRLPDSLGAVGATIDFAAADAMQLRSRAELNNFSLNLVFGPPDRAVSFIVGARFLRLSEEMHIDAFNAARLSSYEVGARNDLYGVHGGGRWEACTGPFRWEAQVLAGVCDNESRQTTFLTDNNRNTVLRNFAPSRSLAAFVGEASLGGSYIVNRTWSIRAGYDVLVATNMARAADQFDFSNNSTSGSRIFHRTALLHGFHCGVEARW